jgi:hypothetical protein
VDYIEADISKIQIEDLGGKNLTASTKYGINGTFFDDSICFVHGIAVTKAGNSVRNYASTNATYKRDANFIFSNQLSGAYTCSHFFI